MKKIFLAIAVLGLGIGYASATMAPFPGSPQDNGGHSYILYDDSLANLPSTLPNGVAIIPLVPNPVSENDVIFRHTLSGPVVAGDLLLGEHGIPNSSDPSTWSDVVRFYNNNAGQGIADVYSWDDFSNFGALNVNLALLQEAVRPQGDNSPGGAFTVYTAPSTSSGLPYNTYNIESVVPEPSTVLAGALLLLPFGISTFRVLRKKAVA